MSKFKTKDLAKLGAAVAAAGAGAATGALAAKWAKRSAGEKQEKKAAQALHLSTYRNTERGANARNSKGIYYSNGNYEAFARPEKPEGVDRKVRLPGGQRTGLPGGGLLPGARRPDEGRAHPHSGGMDPARRRLRRHQRPAAAAISCGAAGRWRTTSSACGICSAPSPPSRPKGSRVLDEYYWLNKHDPNYSLMPGHREPGRGRPHRRQVRPEPTRRAMEIMKLFFTPDEDLYDKTHRATSSTTKYSTPTSGCTGAPCSPLRTGTARWR